ncbi:MAG: LysR family transcriptional regulator [Lachnospiraceae bacterium]|nr:LysR family transcriptional regulator [Lachnospiraceae bacterium]
MTVNQVLYVLEIAESRSISLAAERLYVSQSALSQQLHRLEDELGYALFLRRGHGLALTPAGERFCEAARPVAESWDLFSQQVSARSVDTRRHMQIGVGARVFSNGLFPKLVAFFETHPEIEISFVTEAGRDFLPMLQKGQLDLVLDVLPSEDYLDHQDDFSAWPLITERQCVLTAREDPRAALSAISLEDLQGSTMISGLEHSSEARILRENFREHGIRISRIYRSDSIDTVMNLVKSGRGLVLGPESFAGYYGVAAIPLSPETKASLQFICYKDRGEKKVIRALRDHLSGICQSQA